MVQHGDRPYQEAGPSVKRAFYGSFVHSVSNKELEYLRDTLLGVDELGKIAFVRAGVAADALASTLHAIKNGQWAEAQLVKLKRGEFIIPGLIDTHTHAPQYPNLGRGQQYQLLDWLSNLTFPTEAKFRDPLYAAKIYESVVNRVISTGTTTCCYYGTLHLDATKILASILHRRGQRCFVGKCNMDRHSAPDYVEKTAADSISDTKEFIKYVRTECCSPLQLPFSASPKSADSALASSPSSPSNSLTNCSMGHKHRHRHSSSASSTSSGSSTALETLPVSQTALVQPILTPRFAISCSDTLMAALQAMTAKDPSLHIQTHLAENPAEIEFTKQLFPFADTYTQVYDHFGLLTRKTVLAHCVHLEAVEMEIIKNRGSGISHCPTSNLNLRSGCSPVAELLDKGIKVGLGTDVSGGFGMGILTALREASVVSKVLSFGEAKVAEDKARGRSVTPKKSSGLPTIEKGSPDAEILKSERFSGKHLPVETLFFLATLGGAEVCDMQTIIGNFLVGKEFDALLVRTGQRALEDEGDPFEDQLNPALFVEENDSLETLFEKFLFAGDDRNIASVFVRGRVIGGAAPLS